MKIKFVVQAAIIRDVFKKKDCHFAKKYHTAKLQITNNPPPPPIPPHHPKVWASTFPSVKRNGKLVSAIYEKMEKCPSFCEKLLHSEIPNYQLPKVWVSAFPSVNGNGKFASAIMKKWPSSNRTRKIPIKKGYYSWMLNVETESMFSVYPTSHLCVILHFLIFYQQFAENRCEWSVNVNP